MKIATWNVNSLNVRLQHVLDWLALAPVDVLCLQELKIVDEKFPHAALEAVGYRALSAGQKTYNGVALVYRASLQLDEADVVRNIPGFEDPQRRVIAATLDGVRIVSAYFPNGQAPGTDKFAYKLRWMAALRDWLKDELQRHDKLALGGDFNVAPEDRDVHDPQAWVGQNLVSVDEREALAQLNALGLHDSFRRFEQAPKAFSWWDYRMLGFRRNAGLRIDHILLSDALIEACGACEIDKRPRAWEQPSDHAPVIADLDKLPTHVSATEPPPPPTAVA
ncbi:MAG: exodeoxyribonuclease III [Janthinobacterium lividum]